MAMSKMMQSFSKSLRKIAIAKAALDYILDFCK